MDTINAKYRAVFTTPDGADVLRDLLSELGDGQTVWSITDRDTLRSCVKHDVAVYIKNKIKKGEK